MITVQYNHTMTFQISAFEDHHLEEMPASMIERFACLPCSENDSGPDGEEDSSTADAFEIDASFSSRDSAFSYLSSTGPGISPMARALERIGNEVAVEISPPIQLSKNQRKKQRKKLRKQSVAAPFPRAPNTLPCLEVSSTALYPPQ